MWDEPMGGLLQHTNAQTLFPEPTFFCDSRKKMDVERVAEYLAAQVNRPKDVVHTMTHPMFLSGLYWGK